MQHEPIAMIRNLSKYLQKHKKLEQIIKQFYVDFQLIPCFGIEIEFYLNQSDPIEFESLISYEIKKEKGNNQFEIAYPPSIDLIDYIEQIDKIKMNMQKIAWQLGGSVNYSAKPYMNDYGNSVHFHINFLDRNGKTQDNLLLHGAKSLCHFMLDTFLAFMPNEHDYARIDHNFLAPTCVAHGGNNRTTAIRTPDSLPKRLEHRVASPSIDYYLVMFTILKSILSGLQKAQEIKDLPKIYGNAFESQYNLMTFPKSIYEAIRLFRTDFY
jgi:glutamine synthetase